MNNQYALFKRLDQWRLDERTMRYLNSENWNNLWEPPDKTFLALSVIQKSKLKYSAELNTISHTPCAAWWQEHPDMTHDRGWHPCTSKIHLRLVRQLVRRDLSTLVHYALQGGRWEQLVIKWHEMQTKNYE